MQTSLHTARDPRKFTQIGIFGLKLCHLATLVSYSRKKSIKMNFFDLMKLRVSSLMALKTLKTWQLSEKNVWFPSSIAT
jgi:hypothetical protein